MSFIKELKRRSVFRVGIAYVLMGWVLLQASDFAFDLIGAPNWVIQSLTVIIVIGLPVALLFAWAFELTPEGIKLDRDVDRTETADPGKARKLNILTIGLLALVILLMGIERVFMADSNNQTAGNNEQQAASPTIAVLPFVNMSSDPEQEYFSDGITEEILNRLAKIKSLQVTARTSVFSFKGQTRDIREVAKILGVESVLEGSVRRDGDQVRITAQLIRASDGFHLWSESYDRKLESIFAVQDEISNEIAKALQISLGINTAASVAREVNPEAYDLYLKARALHRKRGQGLLQAVELFNQSLAIDPDFAPAWAGLSETLNVIVVYVSKQDLKAVGDSIALSREAARKAYTLDPEMPLTLHAMANTMLNQYRYSEAKEYYLKALTLDPDATEIMEDYAHFLLYIWQPEEALKVAHRMLELDPLVPIFQYVGITVNHALGNLEERNRYIDSSIKLSPGMRNLQQFKLTMLLEAGDHDAAREYVSQMALMDHTTTEDLNRAIDWMANPVEPTDSALAQAFWEVPDILLLAGRGDLWVDQVFSNLSDNNWESNIASLSLLNANKAHSEYRKLLTYPKTKQAIEYVKLPAYWRDTGWPPGCRPLGDDDFSCQ